MDEEQIVDFERRIMDELEERRKALGLSETALGQLVYPNEPNPRQRIQALRIKRGHGKPQRLRLGDYMALCRAMKIDAGKLIWKVEGPMFEEEA